MHFLFLFCFLHLFCSASFVLFFLLILLFPSFVSFFIYHVHFLFSASFFRFRIHFSSSASFLCFLFQILLPPPSCYLRSLFFFTVSLFLRFYLLLPPSSASFFSSLILSFFGFLPQGPTFASFESFFSRLSFFCFLLPIFFFCFLPPLPPSFLCCVHLVSSFAYFSASFFHFLNTLPFSASFSSLFLASYCFNLFSYSLFNTLQGVSSLFHVPLLSSPSPYSFNFSLFSK